MTSTLVYDIGIYGHTVEFIEYFIDYINKNVIHDKLVYNIPESNTIGLCIGGIAQRKNITSIIHASSKLDKPFKENFSLLILGKSLDTDYYKEIIDLQKKFNNLDIIIDESYIITDFFESAIKNSDFVFIVYDKFFNSSGILGNSIKHKKLIISSDNGLIGKLVEKYDFGICVNLESEREINDAIEKCIISSKKGDTYRYQNEFFLASHSPEKFVENLLK